MGLFEFIIYAAVVGLIVYLVTTFIPMPAQIKNVIIIAAVVVLVVMLLNAMGIFGHDVRIPRVR